MLVWLDWTQTLGFGHFNPPMKSCSCTLRRCGAYLFSYHPLFLTGFIMIHNSFELFDVVSDIRSDPDAESRGQLTRSSSNTNWPNERNFSNSESGKQWFSAGVKTRLTCTNQSYSSFFIKETEISAGRWTVILHWCSWPPEDDSHRRLWSHWLYL